jgi:6-phospho-beta-glucosidase
MKVAVIGGGSTYTPELVKGFLERVTEFPLTELWLMDVDRQRLETVGGFTQRIVQANGSPFNVILSDNQRESIEGSSYVITQLRVGQMEARQADEYLGHRHGLIGQETTGVGGMSKALRTIPIILEIARDIQEYGEKGALLVNFTNPAGLVTQALHQYAPGVNSVGVCNVAVTAKMRIIEQMENKFGGSIDPLLTELDTLGLNHLSWHRGFKVSGEDIWSQVIEAYLAKDSADTDRSWEKQVVEVLRMLPNYYLKYYYDSKHSLADQEDWPPSRADEVMEIEQDLLEMYTDPHMDTPPDDLMKRGGAYYSTVATQLLNAHHNDLNETHVLNVVNLGAVKDWSADWVLEMPAKVSKQGIQSIPAEPLPPVCFGLIAQVKAYELYTVEAAVHGDRQAAFQALLSHPLGPEAGQIPDVLEDMLTTHRQYLPRFWER